jgi:hypothetical protein
MTPESFLSALDHWLSDDFMSDMEEKILNNRKFTQADARAMAARFGNLYRMVHSFSKDCTTHEDWKQETKWFIHAYTSHHE